jgi:hypothetical protein
VCVRPPTYEGEAQNRWLLQDVTSHAGRSTYGRSPVPPAAPDSSLRPRAAAAFYRHRPSPAKRRRAPASSETEAAVTITAIRSPSVATNRWRLRPLTFWPWSSPRSPPSAVALAVDPARRWVHVTPRLLAHLSAESVVEAWPVPAVTPLAGSPVSTGPLRILMGEQAPFDAPVDDIQQSLDRRSHLEFAVATTRLRWWDHMFDQIPCGINEVYGVWSGVHPQSVLN